MSGPSSFLERIAIPMDASLVPIRLLGDSYTNDIGCLVWTAATNKDGYGVISIDGVVKNTHRIAYAALVGPIPAGMEIDHACCNRACWNPDHLRPMTKADNLRRNVRIRELVRRGTDRDLAIAIDLMAELDEQDLLHA